MESKTERSALLKELIEWSVASVGTCFIAEAKLNCLIGQRETERKVILVELDLSSLEVVARRLDLLSDEGSVLESGIVSAVFFELENKRRRVLKTPFQSFFLSGPGSLSTKKQADGQVSLEQALNKFL
jgi:hypothetical protein